MLSSGSTTTVHKSSIRYDAQRCCWTPKKGTCKRTIRYNAQQSVSARGSRVANRLEGGVRQRARNSPTGFFTIFTLRGASELRGTSPPSNLFATTILGNFKSCAKKIGECSTTKSTRFLYVAVILIEKHRFSPKTNMFPLKTNASHQKSAISIQTHCVHPT